MNCHFNSFKVIYTFWDVLGINAAQETQVFGISSSPHTQNQNYWLVNTFQDLNSIVSDVALQMVNQANPTRNEADDATSTSTTSTTTPQTPSDTGSVGVLPGTYGSTYFVYKLL